MVELVNFDLGEDLGVLGVVFLRFLVGMSGEEVFDGFFLLEGFGGRKVLGLNMRQVVGAVL